MLSRMSNLVATTQRTSILFRLAGTNSGSSAGGYGGSNLTNADNKNADGKGQNKDNKNADNNKNTTDKHTDNKNKDVKNTDKNSQPKNSNANMSSSSPIAFEGVIAATQQPPKGVRAYPHDAPERDFVNYPPFKAREHAGKTRAFIIPEEWCQALYAKTGVTGPYVLFWGALATLCSKEYYVASVDFGSTVSFFLMCAVITKLAGPKIKKFIETEITKEETEYIQKHNDTTKDIMSKIEELDTFKTLPEANTLIHSAKKENVFLQLEAEYRERMQRVYNDVKKRLDYQVAVQNAYKRIEREQAINYINGEVAKAIGPAQEKETFQSGLEQLKALSKKYAGTI